MGGKKAAALETAEVVLQQTAFGWGESREANDIGSGSGNGSRSGGDLVGIVAGDTFAVSVGSSGKGAGDCLLKQ